LFHRRYSVQIAGSRLTSVALIREVGLRFGQLTPAALADFEKVKGKPWSLEVDDEFDIVMLGPWNGSVRVIEVLPESFCFVTLESGGHMKTLDTQIQAWFKTSRRHQDALDIATFTQRRNSRRAKAVRESLEEAKAELYAEGSINGRNKEERDAMLHRLTSNECLELHESEEALEEATFALERARADIARDRQRYALRMLVALATQVPPVPSATRSKRKPFHSSSRHRTDHPAIVRGHAKGRISPNEPSRIPSRFEFFI
jgi:hypothetical protein